MTYLVDFEGAHKTKRDPRKSCFERRYAKLLQMEAHFWFVHLQQFFKQLALTENAVGIARNVGQLAKVLAVHRPEYEVHIFLVASQKAQWSCQQRESFVRNDPARRKHTYYFVTGIDTHDRSVWPGFHEIEDLPIAEKAHHRCLDYLLEDEVFVIVANSTDISFYLVVQCQFPVVHTVKQVFEVIQFSLSCICVQDSFVQLAPYRSGNASFCELDQVWLVIFCEQSFAYESSLLQESFVFI